MMTIVKRIGWPAAVLLAVAGFAGDAFAQRAPIDVPTSAYERPDRLYVLPVFLVASDWVHLAPSPIGRPGTNVAGGPITPEDAATFDRTAANLSTFLRIARLQYRQMLAHPAGIDRGTFALATWDYETDQAYPHDGTGDVKPLILASQWSLSQLIWVSEPGVENAMMLDDVFARCGALASSCPFVFVIVLVHGNTSPAFTTYPTTAGRPFSFGYNGGGGFLRTDYHGAKYAHLNGGLKFSSVIHELGHAFGLLHNWEAYGGSADECSWLDPYSKKCSYSIMSYTVSNWIKECPFGEYMPGYCSMPPSSSFLLPGGFLPEELHNLAKNQLAFPGLTFEPFADATGPMAPQHPGFGPMDEIEDSTVRVESNDTEPGLWSEGCRPTHVLGNFGNVIEDRWAPLDAREMWMSKLIGAGEVAELTIRLPETVILQRVRVYTGCCDGALVPSIGALHREGDSAFDGAWAGFAPSEPDADFDLPLPQQLGSDFVLKLAPESWSGGYVIVRGIRLFTSRGEIFPPREPTIAVSTPADFGSSPASLVGTERTIAPLAAPFDPAHSWHSGALPPGTWVDFEVTLPEHVALASVHVDSGHSSGLHQAAEACLEVRWSDYSFGGQGCVPAAAPVHALATIATGQAWRIRLKVGPTSYLVVRGIRFYKAGAEEYFAPRAD